MRPGRPGSGWRARASSAGSMCAWSRAGKVPRASGDRIKTDKRDAERLARLLAAGELRVRVRADASPMSSSATWSARSRTAAAI